MNTSWQSSDEDLAAKQDSAQKKGLKMSEQLLKGRRSHEISGRNVEDQQSDGKRVARHILWS